MNRTHSARSACPARLARPACSARPARPACFARPARPAHDAPDIRALPALSRASRITRPAACYVHCMPFAHSQARKTRNTRKNGMG